MDVAIGRIGGMRMRSHHKTDEERQCGRRPMIVPLLICLTRLLLVFIVSCFEPNGTPQSRFIEAPALPSAIEEGIRYMEDEVF